MTRFTATVTAGDASAQAGFTVTDGRGSLVGACVIPRHESMADAISDLTALTQRPLLARRHDYGSEIPADIRGSDITEDYGEARKSVISFTPGRDSSPEALGHFLGQARHYGFVTDVILWPEMHRFLPPAQYKVICQLYVPVIREHGFRHVFSPTNFAAIMKDVMGAYWPGDDLIDSVGMVFYPSGLTLNIAADFADAHGKPFGLAEFGADLGQMDVTEAIGFTDYIQAFFAARIAAGKPCGDLIWLDGIRDGDFRLSQSGALVAAYQRMHDTLIT